MGEGAWQLTSAVQHRACVSPASALHSGIFSMHLRQADAVCTASICVYVSSPLVVIMPPCAGSTLHIHLFLNVMHTFTRFSTSSTLATHTITRIQHVWLVIALMNACGANVIPVVMVWLPQAWHMHATIAFCVAKLVSGGWGADVGCTCQIWYMGGCSA